MRSSTVWRTSTALLPHVAPCQCFHSMRQVTISTSPSSADIDIIEMRADISICTRFLQPMSDVPRTDLQIQTPYTFLILASAARVFDGQPSSRTSAITMTAETDLLDDLLVLVDFCCASCKNAHVTWMFRCISQRTQQLSIVRLTDRSGINSIALHCICANVGS